MLFAGLFTVTPASAGRVRAKTKEKARVKERSLFIGVPLRFKAPLKTSFGAGYDSSFVSLKEAEYVFLIGLGWSEDATNAPDRTAQQPLSHVGARSGLASEPPV